VAVLSTLVAFVLVLKLLRYQTKKDPVRESTPLEITSATRGPWWDRQLYGVCTSKESEIILSAPSPTKVKFGRHDAGACTCWFRDTGSAHSEGQDVLGARFHDSGRAPYVL
jgi:hypothetical protein